MVFVFGVSEGFQQVVETGDATAVFRRTGAFAARTGWIGV